MGVAATLTPKGLGPQDQTKKLADGSTYISQNCLKKLAPEHSLYFKKSSKGGVWCGVKKLVIAQLKGAMIMNRRLK